MLARDAAPSGDPPVLDSGATIDRGIGSVPPRRISLFGAPLDTGNLGVSALATSTLAAIASIDPHALITMFDYSRGTGTRSLHLPERTIRYERRGAYRSRRWHRPENLRTMYLSRGLAARFHPNVRAIDRSTAVLDISGGDSFTDLYGPKRFTLITLPKRITLQRHRPLHLLPQTYGPFSSEVNRQQAAAIVADAATAWSRDPQSFNELRELLGTRFDPERHRSGVDVAFLLPQRAPAEPLAEVVEARVANATPTVGINVSGLLANRPHDATQRFGLTLNYLESTVALIRRFLSETDAFITLVPHVRGREQESDDIACKQVLDIVGGDSGRLQMLPTNLDAMESKWVISRLDWFVGARMHSTIAALSSEVPVAAVAYSDKTAGVFDTCGLAEQVFDARRLTTKGLAEVLWASWLDRQTVISTLRRTIPAVIERASEPFSDILARDQ